MPLPGAVMAAARCGRSMAVDGIEAGPAIVAEMGASVRMEAPRALIQIVK